MLPAGDQEVKFLSKFCQVEMDKTDYRQILKAVPNQHTAASLRGTQRGKKSMAGVPFSVLPQGVLDRPSGSRNLGT